MMNKNIRANTVGELIGKLSTLDKDTPIEYEYYAMIFADNAVRLTEYSWGVPDDEL